MDKYNDQSREELEVLFPGRSKWSGPPAPKPEAVPPAEDLPLREGVPPAEESPSQEEVPPSEESSLPEEVRPSEEPLSLEEFLFPNGRPAPEESMSLEEFLFPNGRPAPEEEEPQGPDDAWLKEAISQMEEVQADEEENRRPGADLFEWLQMLLGCVVAAVLLFNCVARLTRVDGDSMNNTLQNGEIMLIWSLGYTPAQGDIVVLNKTTALLSNWIEPQAIVKRVIATGGQTVDVDYDTGTVYVDGQPLDEPYIKEEMYRPPFPTTQNTHWEVPKGSIFVMGDNRNNSTDSRDDRLGPINTDYVLGHAVLALWPMGRFGTV